MLVAPRCLMSQAMLWGAGPHHHLGQAALRKDLAPGPAMGCVRGWAQRPLGVPLAQELGLGRFRRPGATP